MTSCNRLWWIRVKDILGPLAVGLQFFGGDETEVFQRVKKTEQDTIANGVAELFGVQFDPDISAVRFTE